MSKLIYNKKVDRYCSHFVVNTNGHHQQSSLGTLFLMKETETYNDAGNSNGSGSSIT